MDIQVSLSEKIDKEYWKKKLSGFTSYDLVVKNTSEAPQIVTLEQQLPSELVAQIKSMCKGNPKAEFTWLLAYYAVLLRSYFGLDSIQLLSGSPESADDGLLYFGLQLKAEEALKSNIVNVQQEVSDVLKRSAFVSEQNGRAVEYNDFIFSYTTDTFDSSTAVTAEILGLHVHEQGEGEWNLKLTFDRNRIQEALGNQFVQHFVSVLSQFKQHLNQPLQALNLLSETEMSEMTAFSESIGTVKHPTVVEAFEACAEEYSGVPAIQADFGTWTYQELNEKANQVARYLKTEFNIQPGEHVGLVVNNPGWTVPSILAILKLGAAFVPIAPDMPSLRKESILKDADIRTVITEFELMLDMGSFDVNFFAIDIQADTLDDESTNLDTVVTPDALAYIIYTSGTTGKPKGVMIEHRSITNYAAWLSDSYQVGQGDSAMLLSSYTFDLGYTGVWGTLLNGGTLHLPAINPGRAGQAVVDYLIKHEISFIKLTPSLFSILLSTKNFAEAAQDLKLRLIFLGGEPIHVPSIKTYHAHKPDTAFVNHYGPTETTIGTIAHDIDLEELDQYEQLPVIGQAIPNSQVLVLDQSGAVLPAGIKGELCIAGDGLARGYVNDSELTESRFIPHPLNAEKRLYKTGDLAYRAVETGRIVLLGRKDKQVKVRGYRVELEEIRSALLGHEKIANAFVNVLPDSNGNNEIWAYYSLEDKSAEKLQDLQTYLRKYLPEYMVPAKLIPLKAFPVTANGKIDVKALPVHDHAKQQNYKAPVTDQQKVLVAIWEDVLNKKPIGIADDFFKIGGHSLKATQVLTAIHQQLDSNVTLNDIFDYPTIEQLVKQIKTEEQTAVQQSSISPVEAQEFYPISFAQRRLWMIDQFDEAKTAYNVYNEFSYEELDMEALNFALRSLVERHEILRSVFVIEKGEVYQKIEELKPEDYAIQCEDLRNISQKEQKEQFDADRRYEFELSEGPLFRIKAYQLEENGYKVTFLIHHIIFDGWSKKLFLEEFNEFYNSFAEGKPLVKPSLPVQYKDYSAWQHEQVSNGAWKNSEEYWLTQFSNEVPVLSVNPDSPRPVRKTYNGRGITFMIPEEQADKLKNTGSQEGVTQFMRLLTLVKVLLFRYSGQTDLVVGTPIAGRNLKELENQLGFYVNTLAIRTLFNGEDSFEDLLASVKKNTLNAYTHQDYPFDLLIEKLGHLRDISRSPLFDVMVVQQNLADNDWKEEKLTASSLQVSDYEVSKFDLTFSFKEVQNGIIGHINFNTDLFETERIKRMIDHLRLLINAVAEAPQKPLKSLQYLSSAELKELLPSKEMLECSYSDGKTLQALFEEQAQKFGQRTALICDGRELTYETLNKEANKIAHYLREVEKVTPGSLVGLMVERTEWTVIGILGILKSGAAYVPIDPAYPEERKRYILNDTQLPLLLCLSEETPELPAATEAKTLDLKELTVGDTISDENPEVVNKPDDLAYIIFTSGSTGNPKGVLVKHRNVVRLVKNEAFLFDFNEDDTWMLFHSICFDVSVWEIFCSLAWGGRLLVVPKEATQDAIEYARMLSEYKVTVLNQVPSVFLALKEEIMNNPDKYDIRLRYINFAGEALNPTALKAWNQRYPDTTLINMYGITETTVHTTFKEITPQDITRGISNIGRALPSSAVVLLDEAGNPVPNGVVGEIAVAGLGVTQGYLNKPDLTESRFITHPLLEDSKLYLSGDYGLRLANGEFVYQGRKDFQVKIRGYRIEIGEIENQILRCEGIKETIVLGKETENNEKYLAAYYVGEVEKEVLKAHLTQHMPSYMIPAFLVKLDEMPHTFNGKIDKKALPDPEGLGENDTAVYHPPVTELEQVIAGIWSEILNKEQISIYANFLEIGGNSLHAARMIPQIYKELNVKVSLVDFFNKPTIAAMARLVEEVQRSSDGARALNPFQKQVWIEEQVHQNGRNQNLYLYVAIEGEVDYTLAQQAFRSLFKKYNVLNSQLIISEKSGKPVMAESRLDNMPELELIQCKGKAEQEVRKLVGQPVKATDEQLMKGYLLQESEHQGLILFIAHAILLDKSSLSRLNAEFQNAYNALRTGGDLQENADLQDDKGNSAQSIRKQSKEACKAYWLEKAKQDWSEAGRWSSHSAEAGQEATQVRRFAIDSEIINGLQVTAEQLKLNPESLYLAAVQLLVHRYSGLNRFASWITATASAEIGVNETALPLIQEIEGAVRIDKFLTGISERYEEALSHQMPIEEILTESVKLLNAYQKRGIHIGFLDANKQAGDTAPGLETVQSAQSRYDWNIQFDLSEKTETLAIEFNEGIADAHLAEQMAGELQQILKLLPETLDQTVETLSIGTALTEATETIKESEQSFATVIESFERKVEEMPEKTAVVFAGKSLTYKELNEKANALAGYLHEELQVRTEEFVGVMMSKSADALIAMLATLKAGAVYVPLDAGQPVNRLKEIMRETELRVLFTEKQILSEKKELIDEKVSCVLVPDANLTDAENTGSIVSWNGMLPGNTANLQLPMEGEQLAYCLYTSGSTGKPKGVLVEHRNLAGVFNAEIKLHQLGDDMVSCAVTNFSFDVSFLETLLPLAIGGKVVIPEAEKMFDPGYLPALLDSERITDLQGTPTFIAGFVVDSLEKMKDDQPDLAELKRIWIGGESLTGTLVRRLKALLKDVRINNHYGPTEITIDCLAKTDISHFSENMLGHPLDQVQIYVLDQYHRPLPAGVIGELYVGGIGITRGYLNNEKETEKRFLNTPAGRLYRTGDFGYKKADGEIAFVGRKDDQVKVRGNRIELTEVRHALLAHSAVNDALVHVVKEAEHSSYLFAAVKPAVEFPKTKEEEKKFSELLKAYLADCLPGYMVPSRLIVLETLPVNASGKADTARIQQLVMAQEAESVPAEQLNEELVAVLQKVHKDFNNDMPQAYSLSDFTSNAAIVSSILFEDYDRQISLGEINHLKSLAELSSRISGKNERLAVEDFTSVGGQEYYELSHAQKQMWILDQLQEEGGSAYNMTFVWQNSGLKLDALVQAFEALISRHEILRTCFPVIDGEVVQKVYDQDDAHFFLKYTDVSKRSDQEACIAQLLENARYQMFDLQRGPLMSALYVKGSEGREAFALTMHHIIGDAHSTKVLEKEFAGLYEAAVNGKEHKLKPLTFQYKEFAAWQNKAIENGGFEKEKAYWAKQFNTVPPVSALPYDAPRPAFKTFNGANYITGIGKELKQQIHKVCAAKNVTKTMFFLAAVKALFTKWSGQTDITIGSPVLGRDGETFENQVGMYANTLAIRTKTGVDAPFATLLEEVRQTLLAGMDHQLYPFDCMVEELNLPKDPSRSPLFDSMVVFENLSQKSMKALPEIQDSGLLKEGRKSKFDLTFSFIEYQEQTHLTIEYNTDLFKEETIRKMTRQFAILLDKIVSEPGTLLNDIELSLPSEKDTEELSAATGNSSEATYSGLEQHPKSSDTAQKLQKIWSEVLNIQQIDEDDNFFSIGGHSIHAMRIILTIHQEFGVYLKIGDVFRNPTIGQLSQMIDQTNTKHDTTSKESLKI